MRGRKRIPSLPRIVRHIPFIKSDESWDDDLINDLILPNDWNLCDPIILTRITNNHTIDQDKRLNLWHHKRSFMGCFSVVRKKNIDFVALQKWKNNPKMEKTKEIAGAIFPYITNYYDFITTAPPSRDRDLHNYCTFKLCETLSSMTNIPFVISFQKRKEKYRHGRFESLRAEPISFVDGWDHQNKSILFVDDFITSGMTAKRCYEALRQYNNHVDGLIYCAF